MDRKACDFLLDVDEIDAAVRIALGRVVNDGLAFAFQISDAGFHVLDIKGEMAVLTPVAAGDNFNVCAGEGRAGLFGVPIFYYKLAV